MKRAPELVLFGSSKKTSAGPLTAQSVLPKAPVVNDTTFILRKDSFGRPLDSTHQDLDLGTFQLTFRGALTFDNPGAPVTVSIVRLTPRAARIQLPSGAESWVPRKAIFINETFELLSLEMWARKWLEPAYWDAIRQGMASAFDALTPSGQHQILLFGRILRNPTENQKELLTAYDQRQREAIPAA